MGAGLCLEGYCVSDCCCEQEVVQAGSGVLMFVGQLACDVGGTEDGLLDLGIVVAFAVV